MSLLLYLGLWFVVSCVTAPFIGALLGRSLHNGDEYLGRIRISDSHRAPSTYRVADRAPVASPLNFRFPDERVAAPEMADRASRRVAVTLGRRR